MKGKLLIFIMFLAAPAAFAQHGSMKGMDMKGMEKKEAQSVHKATGVVTRVDATNNKVTIKHDPVQSLNWPTMTMAFAVKDKALMQKMAKDKKVEFEFVQQGNEFVVTSVK